MEMRSHWIGGTLYPMTGGFIRRGEGAEDTEREGHVNTEAKGGAMSLQAEESQGLPAAPQAREARNASSIRASRKSQLCRYFDFSLLASRTVRESISGVLSPLVCSTLLQQPWETDGPPCA